MTQGIEAVISEHALNMHKDYLRRLRLKYSVLEKSSPELRGKSIGQISKMRIRDREEALNLKCDIALHELYFSSFGEGYQCSERARACFGSEASFLYELFKWCLLRKDDYVVVHINRGKIEFSGGSCELLIKIHNPLLCIDLCEHSYFLDYGFERDTYLEKLLPYLNISRADKFL